MDFLFYDPCEPRWLCRPFLMIFACLLLIGLIVFIRLIYREYVRLTRMRDVMARRRLHYRQRPQPRVNRRSSRRR